MRSFYPNVANTWTIDNSRGGISFPNCSQLAQNSVYNNAERNYHQLNPTSTYNSSFNQNEFANYWNKIENKFNCTGFCRTSYNNANNQNIQMIKYLFTDINRYNKSQF